MLKKSKTLIALLSLMMGLLVASPAVAEYIYQYKDENGHVRFTDDPGNVPEGKRSDMKQIRSDASPLQPDEQKNINKGRESFQPQKRHDSEEKQKQIPREHTDSDPDRDVPDWPPS